MILEQRQALPLEAKVKLTDRRIREWYDYWDGLVYVSFSGGKDSTALLHKVRELYPDVPAVFIDTGLEYPEIKEFVRSVDNVITVRPKISFRQVIETYGYPVASKEVSQQVYEVRNTRSDRLRDKRLFGGNSHGSGRLPFKWRFLLDSPFPIGYQCCHHLKKQPLQSINLSMKPFVGLMACDSSLRRQKYNKNGCNAFDVGSPYSAPLGFWLESDVWEYIRMRGVSYSTIYDKGFTRTGCMFCMFGVHLEAEPNRFQLMKQTHPKLYDYCINDLGCGDVLDFIGVPC